LSGSRATLDERDLWRSFVYGDLLNSVDAVLQAMHYFNLTPSEEGNQDYHEFLTKYIRTANPENLLDPKVGDAMSSLWKDESINELMKHRTELLYMNDSAP
jgi:guanine nucleotide-binding protein subunit alpha